MNDFSRPIRQPWKPTGYEAMVMQFMRDQGHTGYDNEIAAVTEDYDLIQGEAGPGHGFCPFTQERLDAIDKAVQQIVMEAVDRYDDWKSDAFS